MKLPNVFKRKDHTQDQNELIQKKMDHEFLLLFESYINQEAKVVDAIIARESLNVHGEKIPTLAPNHPNYQAAFKSAKDATSQRVFNEQGEFLLRIGMHRDVTIRDPGRISPDASKRQGFEHKDLSTRERLFSDSLIWYTTKVFLNEHKNYGIQAEDEENIMFIKSANLKRIPAEIIKKIEIANVKETGFNTGYQASAELANRLIEVKMQSQLELMHQYEKVAHGSDKKDIQKLIKKLEGIYRSTATLETKYEFFIRETQIAFSDSQKQAKRGLFSFSQDNSAASWMNKVQKHPEKNQYVIMMATILQAEYHAHPERKQQGFTVNPQVVEKIAKAAETIPPEPTNRAQFR